jgi:hypothetical protein
LLLFVTNVFVGCVKFIKGAKTVDDEWVVSIAVVPFLSSWTYGKGQIDVENVYRGCGLTLNDVGHLLQAPGCVLKCH